VAGDGLIAAYLTELRHSVARLPDADALVAEAEDHLLEAADRLSEGRSRHVAEAEAVARFGSAALVSRICIAESKRGAAVPTTSTRYAGLALLAAPFLALVGEVGNEVTRQPKTGFHGLFVVVLVLSVPALFFGLWGLRRRNGGLGRVGLAALVLALVAPFLSLAAGWGAIVAFSALMAIAICVLAVEMIRAQILPVVPLVLLVVAAVAVLVVTVVAVLVETVGDAWIELVAVAGAPLVIGIMWLGWYMWQERAVDRAAPSPVSA
jgi:lysylphosphatidylglycerol synthetase-like protein (DUF2156 family)